MTDPQTATESEGADLSRFEQTLEELETLVRKLEQGELSLEESLKAFERGVRLTRECQASLRAAEQRVEQVTRTDTGDIERRPFSDESGETDT